MRSLLSLSHLGVSLGGKSVLNDVSFDVHPGEFVGLIGPNGAGKSSLMRAAVGLTASTGTVWLAGDEAVRLSALARARRIAYLAQSREVAWQISVEAVVALGRAPHRTRFAAESAQDREAVERAIRQMGVAEFRNRAASELSGGELARVLIARLLAQDTPLLLADEPTAGLDPAHQISLMRLFADLAGKGRAVIASTHDLGLAARFCTRLILLDRGQVVADGAPDAVLTPQNLAKVYGVRAYFGEAEQRPVVLPIDLA